MAFAAVAGACATTKVPSPWLAADEFMRQMQWERYPAAEAYLPSTEQKRFHGWTKDAEKRKLKITAYEKQDVKWESDTTAVTIYDVKYYAAPEYLEKATDVEVSWRLEKNAWLMKDFPKFGF